MTDVFACSMSKKSGGIMTNDNDNMDFYSNSKFELDDIDKYLEYVNAIDSMSVVYHTIAAVDAEQRKMHAEKFVNTIAYTFTLLKNIM